MARNDVRKIPLANCTGPNVEVYKSLLYEVIMAEVVTEIDKLRQSNPSILEILRVFEEIEEIYHSAMIAMGLIGEQATEITNTAETKMAYNLTSLTSEKF
jgi:hypothetical protein